MPQGPKFDGSDTKFPSWVNVKQCGLLREYTFTSTLDISIADIEIDLASMLARGYTVSQSKRAQASWWILFNDVTCENVRAVIHAVIHIAGSPSKA